MSRGTILVIACVAVAGAPRSAHADYAGLVTIIEPLGPSPAGPRDVYRVYAQFTNQTDRVDAWYGAADHPFTIENVLADGTSLGTGFTNFGGSGGTLPPETPGSARDWDTWATIGVAYGDEAPGGDATSLPNPFPVFINGNSVTSSQGVVTLSPPNAVQGRADFRIQGNDTELRVLLMQLVVNVGQHVKGTINISGEVGGPGNYTSFTALDQTFTSIPEPGSLAALLLLGAFSLRRNANNRGFAERQKPR